MIASPRPEADVPEPAPDLKDLVTYRPGAHVLALDGLRGIAILLVMLSHFARLPGDTSLEHWLFSVTTNGWIGVDLFFVLSGFLITGILYDAKASQGYFKNFYARRFLRIFPVYYAMLAVVLGVLPLVSPLFAEGVHVAGFGQVWYWLYLTNFSIAAHGYWGGPPVDHLEITWSLAIEEQFYLVWPFVVLLFARRRLMALCAALIGLACLFRVTMLVIGFSPVAVYVLTPGRVDGLAMGALIALAARGDELARYRRWALPLVILSALVFGVVGKVGGFDYERRLMAALGFTPLAGIFGGVLAMVLGASPGSWLRRVLETPSLRLLGRYSYALYLVHLPIRLVIQTWFYDPDPRYLWGGSALPSQIGFTVTGIGLALGVAWLSWRYFESPILALKRYFPSR